MSNQRKTMRAYKLSRTGVIDPNPMSFITDAGVFSSSVVDGTVLLTSRDEKGLNHYVLIPEGRSGSNQAASHLARAVAARADEVTDLPDLNDAERIVWLETERHPTLVSRDTQSGASPTAVGAALAISMRPGDWVGVVLRKPSPKERRWQLTWLESQMNTANPQYHSRRSEALVATFYAGSESAGEAAQLLREAAAAMPGFDIATRQVTASRMKDASKALLATIGLVAVGVGAGLPEAAYIVDGAPASLIAYLLSGVGVFVTALLMTGHIAGPHGKLRRALANHQLPMTKQRTVAPNKPVKEGMTDDGKRIAAKDGGYGFAARGFLVGQEIPVSLVAPHGGSASGEVSTALREAPAVMNQIIGPRIGRSNGRWVALSARDLWQGVFFAGVPGSGKSVALRNIWAWACLERARPSGLAGFPGTRNVVIALETKGQGAAIYQQLARQVGDSVGLAELTNPETPAIDMFPRTGSLSQQVRTIVGAMKYVWGEISIGAHSFNILERVFAGALVCDNTLVSQAAGIRLNASPFYYANILLGGHGDDAAVLLGGMILSEAARVGATEDDDLGYAAQQLSTLFTKGVTPAQRKTMTEAPRNKAAKLMSAEGWWSREQKVSWDQVLQNNWGVVVNVGSSAGGAQVDDETKQDMSAMLMYSLYDAIQRNCSTWYDEGRSVSIFADELSEIAGSNADIIEWLKDKGRGFGVVPVFATQRPGQLNPQVRESVMGFGTVLSYAQEAASVMAQIVSDLVVDGSDWSTADIANLQPYEAIVRTRVAQVRQTAFTVKLHNFETDMSAYQHIQTTAVANEL
jgi:hypothetical protein